MPALLCERKDRRVAGVTVDADGEDVRVGRNGASLVVIQPGQDAFEVIAAPAAHARLPL